MGRQLRFTEISACTKRDTYQLYADLIVRREKAPLYQEFLRLKAFLICGRLIDQAINDRSCSGCADWYRNLSNQPPYAIFSTQSAGDTHWSASSRANAVQGMALSGIVTAVKALNDTIHPDVICGARRVNRRPVGV
jgi:hypothetical protein